mmetsp:Transcript_1104/g.2472  ORF Transcript_1104/g.2472 Transcript_1104/m.2472 type:complete len:328 (+) Transcript_1104:154-1137(+)
MTIFGGNALFLAAFMLQAILMGSTISGSHGWLSPTATSENASKKQGCSRSRNEIALSSSASNDVAVSAPPFAAIVGNGRIGGALSEAGNCVVLGRGDSFDADGEGPILLATRNDALDEIIENCPENRRKDLVFLQNGYLDDFLEKKGLSENSQVLLYLSVPAKGVAPTDGVTTFNPEGLTASTGEWAQAFADRLASIDLKCNVVSAKDYRPAMFEKLMWISTYMLVGAANNCATVGDAGKDHSDTVESIVKELVAAVSAKEGIEFPEGTLERLKSYTDVVADFPCGVKEFEWRNQYFWNLGDEAVPTHNGLLKDCAERDLLPFELPK